MDHWNCAVTPRRQAVPRGRQEPARVEGYNEANKQTGSPALKRTSLTGAFNNAVAPPVSSPVLPPPGAPIPPFNASQAMLDVQNRDAFKVKYDKHAADRQVWETETHQLKVQQERIDTVAKTGGATEEQLQGERKAIVARTQNIAAMRQRWNTADTSLRNEYMQFRQNYTLGRWSAASPHDKELKDWLTWSSTPRVE